MGLAGSLGAVGNPRWLGAAECWGCNGCRVAVGRSPPPCTGQLLAGDKAADSRSLLEFLSDPVMGEGCGGQDGSATPAASQPRCRAVARYRSSAVLPYLTASLHHRSAKRESAFPTALGIAAVVGACGSSSPGPCQPTRGSSKGWSPGGFARKLLHPPLAAGSPPPAW